jgi:hypothetical protein
MGGACSYMGEMRNSMNFLPENVRGWDQLEDLDIDGKIILKWILGE